MRTIRLPIPPSVNMAYGNNKSGRGRGRYKTRSYREWTRLADGLLLMQMPIAKTCGPYEVRIRLPRTRGDIDNRCKPAMDYLVSRNLTDDDKHARRVTVEIDPALGRLQYCEIDIMGVVE